MLRSRRLHDPGFERLAAPLSVSHRSIDVLNLMGIKGGREAVALGVDVKVTHFARIPAVYP